MTLPDQFPPPDVGCQPCRPDCANPFRRVAVSYLVVGGTRVYWELRETFLDPMPYWFTLQVGQTSSNAADDWEDVGLPVLNAFTAVDGQQRVYGKNRWQFYRVGLTTPAGTYYSDPTALLGTLGRRDWRQARSVMRQEVAYMKNGDGQLGYLLKRRVTGTRCPVCLDPQTLEVTDPYCRVCWGTGFLCGYFFPVDCVWADVSPRTVHVNLDGTRGPIADVAVKARMVNVMMLAEEDVWVNKVTDDRYYVHSVQGLVEFRGVPIVASVEARPAPDTDPIYEIQIPGQLEPAARQARGDFD